MNKPDGAHVGGAMLRLLAVLLALGPLACSTTHSQAARGGELPGHADEEGLSFDTAPEELPPEAPGAEHEAPSQDVPSEKVHRGPERLSEMKPGAPSGHGQLGNEIAARASRFVGISSLRAVDRSLPDDCTGIVRLVYESVGIDLMKGEHRRGEGGVTHIYQNARHLGAVHRKRPRPGDLVFFQETYDRNRDGHWNDGLTHIGIVERVEPNGQVFFIHRGSKGVARARLYLPEPEAHRREDTREVLNDYLRRRTRTRRAYLTGELFVGFASPESLVQVR